SFKVEGIPMTDFVYPSYFEIFRKPKSTQFDYMKRVTRPFQILAGGYQIVFKNGRWTQTFASATKKRRFEREDRRQHRSEQRKHGGARQLSGEKPRRIGPAFAASGLRRLAG